MGCSEAGHSPHTQPSAVTSSVRWLVAAILAQFVRTGDPSPDGSGLVDWTPWSNAAGEQKCVLVNADLNTASIAMSTVEVTEGDVMARIDAEVRQVIDSFSGTMPFLVG